MLQTASLKMISNASFMYLTNVRPCNAIAIKVGAYALPLIALFAISSLPVAYAGPSSYAKCLVECLQNYQSWFCGVLCAPHFITPDF